jgi:hypothetical protein
MPKLPPELQPYKNWLETIPEMSAWDHFKLWVKGYFYGNGE